MAKKKEDKLQVPLGETKVLLHTCCAPCSGAIIERLMKEGITPVIYYCNPNIYPYEEYVIRKDECTRFAQSLGLEIVDDDYDHENWLAEMAGLENEPERGGRCLKCFKLRLLRTAKYASEHGFKVLTTTLASSRWKSLDQINAAGEWACAQVAGHQSSGEILGQSVDGFVCQSSGEIVGQSVDGSVCQSIGEIVGQSVDGSVCQSENVFADVPVDVEEVNDRTMESGPVWWDQNWRKGGLQERRGQIIKEYNFYNQLYCGCEFSMASQVARSDKGDEGIGVGVIGACGIVK